MERCCSSAPSSAAPDERTLRLGGQRGERTRDERQAATALRLRDGGLHGTNSPRAGCCWRSGWKGHQVQLGSGSSSARWGVSLLRDRAVLLAFGRQQDDSEAHH